MYKLTKTHDQNQMCVMLLGIVFIKNQQKSWKTNLWCIHYSPECLITHLWQLITSIIELQNGFLKALRPEIVWWWSLCSKARKWLSFSLEEIKAPLVWWISWFVTIVDELWKSNKEPKYKKKSASNLVSQSLKAVRIPLWKHQKARHLINRVYVIQIEIFLVYYAARKNLMDSWQMFFWKSMVKKPQ